MRVLIILGVALAFAVTGLAHADYDDNGDDLSGAGGGTGDPGDPCGECPDPASSVWGVAFDSDGDMWIMGRNPNIIFHLVDCSVVETITVTGIGSTTGLGYDSVRDYWIITDASADRIYQVDMSGAIVASWPAPCTGPVGAAYDAGRDLYWITDWVTNRIVSLDPNTGSPGPAHNAPAGSRLTGTGYDAHSDVIFYHGRDQAYSYWMDAETGALMASHPIPFGGLNNGSGAGCEPDGDHNGWLTHTEQPTIFCVEGFGATPAVRTTWAGIKQLQR